MANEILWTLVNTLTRYTAVLLINTVFKVMVHQLARGLLVVIVLHTFATLLATCLICRPIAAAWESELGGTCGNQLIAYVVLESVGALIDVAIIVVPLPIIWKLRLSWQKKAVVSIFFSVGAL